MSLSADYTRFKGITSYTDVQLMNEIESNLKIWLDWSLLSIGAWTNATGYSGTYYGHPSKLNWVKDASYQTGQTWQSNRKDWVWETGVDYNTSYNPINITGVIISGIGTGNNYSINYPLGRVIFAFPVNTGAIVTVNYSYRNVQVYRADDAPWWKELQYRSFDSNDSHFKQDPRTGDWSVGAYQRIQLPAIVIETVPKGISRGYEMGNGSLEVDQDVLFHILADNRSTRNDLTSILFLQNDKYVYLFDCNKINSGELYPLSASGTRRNNLLYPEIVSATGFRAKKCRFTKTTMSEVQSTNTNLFEGVVRTTLNVIFPDI